MRYLVLTDIHANLEALDACLADATGDGTTGRSCSATSSATAPIPTPSSTACRRSSPIAMVRGNHDKVACGLEQPDGFNVVAKSAALWTLRSADAGSPGMARCGAQGAASRRRPDRDLPWLAVRRRRVHLRRARRHPRAEGLRAAALPVRPHALSNRLGAAARRARQPSKAPGDRRPSSCDWLSGTDSSTW